jgi:hypothetical protein
MQMSRRVIRTTGIVFIRFLVEHFRDDILLMRLSELLKLMKSVSHRPCSRIEPQVSIASPLPAAPTVALIEKSAPNKTYKSIEASKQKHVQIHTISPKILAKVLLKTGACERSPNAPHYINKSLGDGKGRWTLKQQEPRTVRRFKPVFPNYRPQGVMQANLSKQEDWEQDEACKTNIMMARSMSGNQQNNKADQSQSCNNRSKPSLLSVLAHSSRSISKQHRRPSNETPTRAPSATGVTSK